MYGVAEVEVLPVIAKVFLTRFSLFLISMVTFSLAHRLNNQIFPAKTPLLADLLQAVVSTDLLK